MSIDKKNTHEHRIADMPHKCTNCEHIFEDGSVDILNGCPNCGWNKFLYVPAKSVTETETETETDAEDTDTPMQSDKVEKKEEAVPAMDVESIRILETGSYELNLESLLEREEIIMSMKEDGRYIVHLPSVFEKGRKDR
ncbi:MAG: Zn-ribbon domain-containing protein [Euryarchaeota archaeon]|nr:Zn-ribbon domain-containing protein [Euryarchaeota archaeon]